MPAKRYEEKYMRFPEGKPKAVTFSYDDSVAANVKLLEIFKKYGLRATFNLNSHVFTLENNHGEMTEEEFLKAFGNCGQEIALHGARHIFMDKVPLCEAVKEITDNRQYLESRFDIICNGMAYAYGVYNDEIVSFLKTVGVKYARTVDSSYSFDMPKDWLRLNPTCHHTDPKLAELAEKFLERSPEDERKFREPWLFYIWGHAYEFDDSDNWDLIERLAEKLSSRKDIWFATNGELYDYAQAYSRLEYSFDGERVKNPSAVDVFVELRGKVYGIKSGEEVVFGK